MNLCSRLGICVVVSLSFSACISPITKDQTKGQLLNSERTPSADTGSYNGLGSESVSQDKIKEFAPRSHSRELSRKIQSYLDVRSPGMGMLHPKKKKFFFTWRVTGVSQIWRLDEPKGFPIQMTGGEDQTGLSEITPDGRWLVVSRDHAGEENPGLYLQKTEGGALIEIQHIPKVQTSFLYVTSDSKFIYYRSNDREPDSYAIYRYEIASGKKELVFGEKGLWTIGDVWKDRKFLFVKMTGSLWREYYEWDLETKNLVPLLGQGEKEQYSMVYGNKENEYFVVTDKLSDFSKVYLWSQKSKKLVPFKPVSVKGEIDGLAIDDAKSKMIISYSYQGYAKVVGFDLSLQKMIDIPTFPEADQLFAGGLSRDGQHLMLGIVTHNSPRISYSYNLKTKMKTQWVIPSQPEIDTTHFVRAKLSYFPTRDGGKIPYFAREPEKCKKGKNICPIIVHFHGGPEGQSVPGFSLFAQSLVDEGFIFIEPNVRGSEGYGKAWLAADDGPKRLKVITDIEDASLYFRKEYAIGERIPKIGVMGGSYGGYSTLMAMTKFAGAYDAGSSNVGMSNLVTFLQNTAPYRRILRMSEYGDLEKDRDSLVQLSPVTYISALKDPLLILQGVSDPRVPVGEAIQMYEALKAKGVKSELVLFADEGHGSQKRGNQALEWEYQLRFFKENLMLSQ